MICAAKTVKKNSRKWYLSQSFPKLLVLHAEAGIMKGFIKRILRARYRPQDPAVPFLQEAASPERAAVDLRGSQTDFKPGPFRQYIHEEAFA